MVSAALSPDRRWLVSYGLVGAGALTLATLANLELGFDHSAAGFVYLIVIVMLSLVESYLLSIVFSLLSSACLNFFFVPPIYTFRIRDAGDIVATVAFLFTTLAVTGLVRHASRLGRARREQATLIDLTHDTVVVRDAAGRIVFWNRAAEQMYGWTRSEALGRPAHALLNAKLPITLDEIDRTLTLTDRWEGEIIHTRRDGALLTVASRWSVLRDESGQVVSTLETNNDITERKRAEAALQKSQAEYLAEAQKLSRTGSFGWNFASGELTWSEQTFGIFDYPDTTRPTISRMLERVHPDELASVKQQIDEAIENRHDVDIEARLRMPDASIKHIHVVARVIDPSASELRYIGAIMDITESKRSETQLHDMQARLAHVARVASLGELSASMAHEVRQPLTAIVLDGDACMRWLHRDVPCVDEALACVERMVTNGTRAGEIVQRIRLLTRRPGVHKRPLSLNAAIEDVMGLVQRELVAHRVTLTLDLAPGLPPLSFDRVELQQLIINLVMNAIEALAPIDDRPRELHIATRLDADGMLVVSVRDNGTGILAENASRIFEALFTTHADAMGMGLPICRSIVETHGGRIRAVNNDDYGAMFECCLLPITDGAAAAA